MKKLRQVLLFAIVLLLLVGVASASDVESNDTVTMETSTTTSTSTPDANPVVQKDIDTPIEDIQEKDIINEKKITKKDENNLKTESQTFIVGDFEQLDSALHNDNENVALTVNYNITLTDSLSPINSAIKNLTINGNGYTINGIDQYHFLTIGSNQIVIINNSQ